MASPEIDLLALSGSAITAPAGCGKTHLIADALSRHHGAKPVLVLTHTNAGVAALRGRLDRAKVSRNAYRVATIDGWALRLISMFPARSAHEPEVARVERPPSDYPAIRAAASRLLASGHVGDLIEATYSHLIVDEYQDSSILQHTLISEAAAILPTCVLGDPMQAIFGFGSDPLARWEEDVRARFPVAGELSTPWRWINANSEALGRWLLEARGKLMHGESIDLRIAPEAVSWIKLDRSNDHEKRLAAARVRPSESEGRVLIIGDSTSPAGQRQIASQTPGAVTVEAVDLKDLVSFARSFDPAASHALDRLLNFASAVMTNVGAKEVSRRIKSLTGGTARKGPSKVEQSALNFVQTPSHRAAMELLVSLENASGVRTHRPALLRACTKALHLCASSKGLSFYDAALRMRENYRFSGRPLPRRAVGSTLLLKGLEAEVAVILNPADLDARNLYVAMTRASTALTICSENPALSPA